MARGHLVTQLQHLILQGHKQLTDKGPTAMFRGLRLNIQELSQVSPIKHCNPSGPGSCYIQELSQVSLLQHCNPSGPGSCRMQELSQVSLLQPLQPLRARNEQPHPRNSARFHCYTTATPQGQEAAASRNSARLHCYNTATLQG